MSRLIDADKIDFNEVFVGQSDFAKDTRDAARSLIDAQPTVEAVPVVRCKDCKHSDLPAVLTRKYGKAGTLTCHNRYGSCNNRNVNENDFCSAGELPEQT